METSAEAGNYLVTNALVFTTDDDRNSGGMIVRAGNRNRAIVHIAPDGLKVFAEGDSPNHVVTRNFLGKVTNSVLQISSQKFAKVDAKLDQKLSVSGGVMHADIVFDNEAALRHADGANFIQFQSPENEMFVIAESRTKSIQIAENYEGDFLLNETDAGNLSIKESGFGKMILSEKDDDNQEFREEDDGDQIFSETGLGEQLIFSDSKTTISSTNIVIGSTVSGAVVSVVGGNISLQGDTIINGILNLAGNSITGVKSIVTEKLNISQTSEFHKIAQFFAGANFNNTEISGVSTITVAKIITSGVIDPLGIEFIPTNAKPSGFSHPVLWASNEVIRNLCWENKTVAMKEDLLNSTSENWPNGAPNFYVKKNANAGNSGSFESPVNDAEWFSKGNGAFHFAPGNYDNISLPNNGIFTLVGHSGQDNFAAKFDKITIPANGSFNFVNLNIDELNFSVPAATVFASVNFYNCKINSLSNETEYLNLCLGHFYLNGDLKLRVKSAAENAMVHASGLRVDGNWNVGEFGTQHIVIYDSDSSIILTGDYPLIIRKTSNGNQPALQCEGNLTMQGSRISDLASAIESTDALTRGQIIGANGIERFDQNAEVMFGIKNYEYNGDKNGATGTFVNLDLHIKRSINIGTDSSVGNLNVKDNAIIEKDFTAGNLLFVNEIDSKVGIGISGNGITDKLTVNGEINALNHRVLGVSNGTKSNDAINLQQMEQAIYNVKTNIASTIPTDLVQTYIKSGLASARMCEIKKRDITAKTINIRHRGSQDCSWRSATGGGGSIEVNALKEDLNKCCGHPVYVMRSIGGIVGVEGPFTYTVVGHIHTSDGHTLQLQGTSANFANVCNEGESLLLLPDSSVSYGKYSSATITSAEYEAAIAPSSFGIEKSSSADGKKDIHISYSRYINGVWYFWYGRYDKSSSRLYSNCNGVRFKVIFAPKLP